MKQVAKADRWEHGIPACATCLALRSLRAAMRHTPKMMRDAMSASTESGTSHVEGATRSTESRVVCGCCLKLSHEAQAQCMSPSHAFMAPGTSPTRII